MHIRVLGMGFIQGSFAISTFQQDLFFVSSLKPTILSTSNQSWTTNQLVTASSIIDQSLFMPHPAISQNCLAMSFQFIQTAFSKSRNFDPTIIERARHIQLNSNHITTYNPCVLRCNSYLSPSPAPQDKLRNRKPSQPLWPGSTCRGYSSVDQGSLYALQRHSPIYNSLGGQLRDIIVIHAQQVEDIDQTLAVDASRCLQLNLGLGPPSNAETCGVQH